MILTKTVMYRGKIINIEDVKKGSQIPIQVQCPICEIWKKKQQSIANK